MTESGSRFPGESDDYREARNKLLDAEVELRRATERVAALRRDLPAGGQPPEDYVFTEADPGRGTRPVRLSELFAPGLNSLVVYNMMYGPEMEQPCPSCSSIVDALDATGPHLTQRANLVVVIKSPLDRLLAFAGPRGWRHARFLSSADTTFNRDYGGETAEGYQMPMLNVFRRDPDSGEVRHFWGAELLWSDPDPGEEGRSVDMVWPLWSILDLIPEGRGTDPDFPRLTYDD
jgi:predicted dithiol-disulfide oxidoreductase (DUF899 family)